MAKVTLKKKKKVSKKEEKKSAEVKEESAEVVYDDDEEDEGSNEEEESEEEEEDEDERRRMKLLEAISSLGGQRKRRTLGERSEAAVHVTEFGVTAEGEGDKVQLKDLIGTVEKTPTVPSKTKRQLRTLQGGDKTIECPLSKQEHERIQRGVAFQKAASEVDQWKSIIQQNQRAEQLVFPLNREPSGPKPMERVVSGWKARTPLEEEIFAVLNANKQPILDPVLTPAEEASISAMSLEEAKIRRAELQKVRALQSYYEAKARRERKIKSKKYHRVQNKAKRKEFVKRFDDMVKTDPSGALEELEKMERARMQERMSLKHQNSGKWARSKAVMAKYDEGARRAMQQQLEVNKELTQKLVTAPNDEDEEEEEEQGGDAELLPDFVNDAERGADSSNPWMRGKLSEEKEAEEESERVDLTAEEEVKETEEEEVKETEEEGLLKEFERRRKQRQEQEVKMIPVEEEEEEEKESERVDLTAEDEEKEGEEEEEEGEEAGGEEEELSEFKNLYREITESERAEEKEEDPSPLLEESLARIRSLEDTEELLAQEEAAVAPPPPQTPAAEENSAPAVKKVEKPKKRKRGIELRDVLTKDTRAVHVPLTQTVEDGEEEEDEEADQRGLIKEAFAGDDVVSDFLRDKRNQEDAGKPKVVDLTLPGWGEWGGSGLAPSKKKRRRFRIKTAPPPPRKDQRLPSVIISEQRNSAIAPHQVSMLPFPFQTQAQFEGTIRTPLGRTWNTERTVKKVVMPKVVTTLGAIIEPMAKEELIKEKQQQQTTMTMAASQSAVEKQKKSEKKNSKTAKKKRR
ncbi:U3 small nucleolar RNA-associated protein 14 homolog A [Xyrichtys novacula]|uniref:U3 small nucleolar RNA-associated protein 14 homolog A n=1 Tax=Xyrichtys novacula TaxID=13765 RepID=A0AAV1GZC4_XYRNO|nr:U3 small nucleolar RNA-associated protein 14 homolog A [Xyrichtys novacula]